MPIEIPFEKLREIVRYVRDHPGVKRRRILRACRVTVVQWNVASRLLVRKRLLVYRIFPTGWFTPAGARLSSRGTGWIGQGHWFSNSDHATAASFLACPLERLAQLVDPSISGCRVSGSGYQLSSDTTLGILAKPRVFQGGSSEADP